MSEPVTEKITDKNYRSIPYRKHDIVEMCLQDGTLALVSDNELLTALPVTQAIKKLDSRWDDYFVPANV